MIPYGKQSISEEDIRAVVEVLRSDFLTCGPKVEEFESAFAAYCGAKHAVSCSNGTAALHLAMLAGGVTEGDVVVTSPLTFLASANAGRYVGAEIEFRDVEVTSLTLDADLLESNWNPNTKAVVAVDFAGHPADLERLSELCNNNGALLIEDASHSVGGAIQFEDEVFKIGAVPGVDMTTFSFHPVKTMTTGEGGMVTTDSDILADRLKLFRNHGMERRQTEFRAFGIDNNLLEIGPWSYEMHALGFNYRLTDMQCALGISQLSRLDSFVSRRRCIWETYNEAFQDLPHLRCPGVSSWVKPGSLLSWHLYPVRIDFEGLGRSRPEVMGKLRSLGVGTQVHYIPVSSQPYYGDGNKRGLSPVAADFYHEALSLPLFPGLTDEEIELVIGAIKRLHE